MHDPKIWLDDVVQRGVVVAQSVMEVASGSSAVGSWTV